MHNNKEENNNNESPMTLMQGTWVRIQMLKEDIDVGGALEQECYQAEEVVIIATDEDGGKSKIVDKGEVWSPVCNVI